MFLKYPTAWRHNVVFSPIRPLVIFISDTNVHNWLEGSCEKTQFHTKIGGSVLILVELLIPVLSVKIVLGNVGTRWSTVVQPLNLLLNQTEPSILTNMKIHLELVFSCERLFLTSCLVSLVSYSVQFCQFHSCSKTPQSTPKHACTISSTSSSFLLMQAEWCIPP